MELLFYAVLIENRWKLHLQTLKVFLMFLNFVRALIRNGNLASYSSYGSIITS